MCFSGVSAGGTMSFECFDMTVKLLLLVSRHESQSTDGIVVFETFLSSLT